MINLNDEIVVLTGGFQEEVEDVGPLYLSDQTWFYNLKLSQWTLTGLTWDMPRYGHGCGLLYDSSPGFSSTFYLVVFGGKTAVLSDYPYLALTDKTDLMELTDQEEYVALDTVSGWISGTPFPFEVSDVAVVQAPSKKILFAIGGRIGFRQETTTIFQFQCWNQICDWTEWGQKLEYPKEAAMALILPNSYADCN